MEVKLGWPTWIGIVVDDLARQRRFYGGVLGFGERQRGVGWVQFDVGGVGTLELIQRSDRPEYDRLRCQVGYAVVDIEKAREALIARGVEPVSSIFGTSQRWCYFRDPEGNVFELKEDPGSEPSAPV